MTLVADWNSSINVPFQRMRQMQIDGALQEGVVGASDLMVVQRGAGVNQSVDVGTGFAWVQIDSGTRNGMGHVTNDAVANVTVTAANGTNPRIDQIILRWNDTSIPTGSGNVPTLEVLAGTATSGATLANRTGAASLPNDCLRLADLLIPQSSTTISNTQIRDRRPWARGAYIAKRTGGTPSTTSTTFVAVTGMLSRIECSGVPMLITLAAQAVTTGSVAICTLGAFVDGSMVDSFYAQTAVTNGSIPIARSFLYTPTAGSHTFDLQWKVSVNTWFAETGWDFIVQEIIRPNTVNNSTTSG
jgi:hypothetical protein